MKSRHIVFVCAALGLLLWYQLIPADPTQSDLAAIRRVVGKHTSETVLHIQPLPSGAVEVTTGWVKGPLSGDGEKYKLRKIFGLWWVYSKSH
jgi:hypothetical protein